MNAFGVVEFRLFVSNFIFHLDVFCKKGKHLQSSIFSSLYSKTNNNSHSMNFPKIKLRNLHANNETQN